MEDLREDRMLERIIGVFRLDSQTFEEIEHDPNALSQAALVVLAVALAGAISGLLNSLIGDGPFMTAVISPIIGAFVGWFLWALVVYLVGTSVFHGDADLNEMLRVTGFAYAPQLLGLLGFIPCLGWALALAGLIWSLIAMIIAIRQGLDVDSTSAVVTAIIGWIVVLIINLVVSAVFGGIFALGAIFGG
jgi:hypothetical protein